MNRAVRYLLQAQPGGASHTRSTAMQVFPQAFPLWHVRQHEERGAGSGRDGVLHDVGGTEGASPRGSVSHELEPTSLTHSESSELTSCTGRGNGSRLTGAGSSGSGISDSSRFRRHAEASTTSTMTATKTRVTHRPSVASNPGPSSLRRKMMGALTTFLSLTACGGVNTGQSLEVPADSEPLLGHGFDSLSGLTRGACVEPKPVRRFEEHGSKTKIQVFHARSKEEIVRQVGFSGGISLGLFGFGADLGFEALDRDVHRSTTTFAVVRVQIEALGETLRDYRLAKHAVDTLRREGTGKFYEKCGDGFVARIRQGGLFLGIVALDAVADEDVKHLSGSAGVSFLGFGVHGGAGRETRDFLEKHRARYYIVQNGGGPGGWGSVKELESIDSLLRRAQDFERFVDAGRTVPTRLVVRPYQVASNLPRRAELWTLIEQRRFLDELAVKYGDIKRASAELRDKMAQNTCTRRRETRELEQLRDRYAALLTAIPRRAQDCLNNPRRQCSDRGLDSVEPRAHQAALELCKTQENVAAKGRSESGPAPQRPHVEPPPPKPGVTTECKLWQLSSLSARDGASASRGATSTLLFVDQKKIPLPTQIEGSTSRPLSDVYVKPGARVLVRVWSGSVFGAALSKTLQEINAEVPQKLPDGRWTLEKGQVRVVFQARCLE